MDKAAGHQFPRSLSVLHELHGREFSLIEFNDPVEFRYSCQSLCALCDSTQIYDLRGRKLKMRQLGLNYLRVGVPSSSS